MMITWNETVEKFTHVTDKLGKEIDPGIFDTVVALNVLGFHTTMSCEGHINWGLAAPWVDVIPDGAVALNQQIQVIRQQTPADQPFPDEAKQLMLVVKRNQQLLFHDLVKLLDQFYEYRHITYARQLIPHMSHGGHIRIEPIGADLQTVVPDQIKEQQLRAYQTEMSDFTAFLKARIPQPLQG